MPARDFGPLAREERLDGVLAEYLEGVEAGLEPDRRALLVRHPEFYDELTDFFDDRDAFESLAGPIRETVRDLEDEASLVDLDPSENPDHLGRLGPYELIDELGRGGMGVVFLGLDPTLNRFAAIKVLAPQWSADPNARRRFLREARSAAAISHPHVVTIHAVGEWKGRAYLVMEYVPGPSLQERLDEEGPPSIADTLAIAIQVASGLAAAHAQGLIHRDIKPGNVLLEGDLPRAKLGDFGLARSVDDVGLTRQGILAGTPQYMAPEQARGESLDARTDLFSLGGLIYALCTGEPPFRGASTPEVLRRVSDESHPSARRINPEVPDWLVEIIDRLMAKDPAKRFATAAEVADLLERRLAGLRDPSSAPPVADRGKARNGTANRLARAFALSLLAGLVVGLAAFVGQPWTGPNDREPSRRPPTGADAMPDRVSRSWLTWPFLVAASVASASEPGPLANTFRADFTKEAFDVRDIALTGGHAEELVHAEPLGLRIKMPPGMGKPEGVGIKPRFKIRGDFDLSATFEILQADKPTEGYGVGAQMSLETESPTKEAATAEWTYTPGKDGTRFISTRIVGQADGNRQYRVQSLAANRRAGTLRLVRTGPTLRASYRDEGDSTERSLPAVELGTEDVAWLKVVANTGISDHPVDIRLKTLTLSADELPGWSGSTATSSSGSAPGGGIWKPILIGIAAMVVVGILFLLFGATRTDKAEAPPKLKGPPARGDEPAAEWDEATLAALEEQAREYARTQPESELYFEPGHCQFTLKSGVLEGPCVVWWKVAVDELKKPGQTWDDLRRQLPKRYRGRYREGRRDGPFQGWDSTGGMILVRFADGARS
jgi:serine/threonine protein kinase